MTSMVETTLAGSFLLLAFALVLAFGRVLRGPTLADRVLALDMIAIVGVGLMAVAGIAFDASVFLDVALILVAAGFVGTAAFAQLVEQQAAQRRESGLR